MQARDQGTQEDLVETQLARRTHLLHQRRADSQYCDRTFSNDGRRALRAAHIAGLAETCTVVQQIEILAVSDDAGSAGNDDIETVVYLALASGQRLLAGTAFFTITSALMPGARAWAVAYPFIRADRRRRVAWESRFVVLLWALLLAAGFRTLDGFVYLLAAWPIAHVFLGFYLMTEHTGLPNAGTQIEKTRTVTSNAAVRWLMWNMPLHTAHHAYPAVPFHHVPALHEAMRPGLLHVSRGYLAFHREAISRALRLRRRSPAPGSPARCASLRQYRGEPCSIPAWLQSPPPRQTGRVADG